jgi:hypothetical protein
VYELFVCFSGEANQTSINRENPQSDFIYGNFLNGQKQIRYGSKPDMIGTKFTGEEKYAVHFVQVEYF